MKKSQLKKVINARRTLEARIDGSIGGMPMDAAHALNAMRMLVDRCRAALAGAEILSSAQQKAVAGILAQAQAISGKLTNLRRTCDALDAQVNRTPQEQPTSATL